MQSTPDDTSPEAIFESTTLPLRTHHGEAAPASTAEPLESPFVASLVYHVDSIEKTAAPGGSPDQDWYRYVLRNDNSTIQGFRRGSHQHVRDYATQYAAQLNERTLLGPSPWNPRGRKSAPSAR